MPLDCDRNDPDGLLWPLLVVGDVVGLIARVAFLGSYSTARGKSAMKFYEDSITHHQMLLARRYDHCHGRKDTYYRKHKNLLCRSLCIFQQSCSACEKMEPKIVDLLAVRIL